MKLNIQKVNSLFFLIAVYTILFLLACPGSGDSSNDSKPTTTTPVIPSLPTDDYTGPAPGTGEIGIRYIYIQGLDTSVFTNNSTIIMNGVGIGGWWDWEATSAAVSGRPVNGTFTYKLNNVSSEDFQFTGGLDNPSGGNWWDGEPNPNPKPGWQFPEFGQYGIINIENPKDGNIYDIIGTVTNGVWNWEVKLYKDNGGTGTTVDPNATTTTEGEGGTTTTTNPITTTTTTTNPITTTTTTTPVDEVKTRIEYYYVDQHDNLVTTLNGVTAILPGETLTITALDGAGYTVKQWYLNGMSTGQSRDTYNFSSMTLGKHIVSLVVEKDSKIYNTNITINVEVVVVTFNINGGGGTTPTSQSVTYGSSITLPSGNGLTRSGYIFGGWNTSPVGAGYNYNAGDSYIVNSDTTLYARWLPSRSVTIDMYDSYGDGWNSGALRINVNGIDVNNVNVLSGYTSTYTFNFGVGDVVRLYWVKGDQANENSFIVYYTDTTPVPSFNSNNNDNWNGSNALIYVLRGKMGFISDGALLGSFTVTTQTM